MRVVRLIVYEGDDAWVQRTIDRSIHGKKELNARDSITVFTLGTMPDDVAILIAKEVIKDERTAS